MFRLRRSVSLAPAVRVGSGRLLLSGGGGVGRRSFGSGGSGGGNDGGKHSSEAELQQLKQRMAQSRQPQQPNQPQQPQAPVDPNAPRWKRYQDEFNREEDQAAELRRNEGLLNPRGAHTAHQVRPRFDPVPSLEQIDAIRDSPPVTPGPTVAENVATGAGVLRQRLQTKYVEQAQEQLLQELQADRSPDAGPTAAATTAATSAEQPDDGIPSLPHVDTSGAGLRGPMKFIHNQLSGALKLPKAAQDLPDRLPATGSITGDPAEDREVRAAALPDGRVDPRRITWEKVELMMMQTGEDPVQVLGYRRLVRKAERQRMNTRWLIYAISGLLFGFMVYANRAAYFYDYHTLQPSGRPHAYTTLRALGLGGLLCLFWPKEELEAEAAELDRQMWLLSPSDRLSVRTRADELDRRQSFRRYQTQFLGAGGDPAIASILEQMNRERTYIWHKVLELEAELGDQRELLFGSSSPEDVEMRSFISRKNFQLGEEKDSVSLNQAYARQREEALRHARLAKLQSSREEGQQQP